MGKQLRHKHSGVPFKRNHPGCMWGLFHILDYHQWHNVKKMLPLKRHGGGRHNGCTKSPELNLSLSDTGEAQELLDAKVDIFSVEESMMETSPNNKISAKYPMKVLISEEMSKENNRKVHKAAYPARSRLLRTYSIHHLEPTDHDFLGGKLMKSKSKSVDLSLSNATSSATSTLESPEAKNTEEPIACMKTCELCATMNTVNYLHQNQLDELGNKLLENHSFLRDKLEKAREALVKQKSNDSKDLNVPLTQSKEFLEVLEIFNISKDLFLNILLDPDSTLANHFRAWQVSNAKMSLNKLISFPAADSSDRRSFRPSTFKNKKEIGSFAKGQLQSGNSAPKLLPTFQSSEEIGAQSVPLADANNCCGVIKTEQEMLEITNDSLYSSSELSNKVAINRFKDIRRRIKHAIRESRKESHRISMDAILHRIPYGHRFSKDVKEIDDQCKEPAMNRDCKESPRSSDWSDASGSANGKRGLYCIRRTSSFNASLDRYARLFESSFNTEVKQHLSERLKLTNEDGVSHGGTDLKSFGRILSLPDLNSYYSLQKELPSDAFCSGMPWNSVEINTAIGRSSSCKEKAAYLPMGSEDCTQIDALVESKTPEKLEEVIESSPLIKDQLVSLPDSNDEQISEAGGTSDNFHDLITGEHEEDIELTSKVNIKLASPSSIADSNDKGIAEASGSIPLIKDQLVSLPDSNDKGISEAGGTSDNFHNLMTEEHEEDIELTSKANITLPSPSSIPDSNDEGISKASGSSPLIKDQLVSLPDSNDEGISEAAEPSDNFHDLITGEHEEDIELTSKANIILASPSSIPDSNDEGISKASGSSPLMKDQLVSLPDSNDEGISETAGPSDNFHDLITGEHEEDIELTCKANIILASPSSLPDSNDEGIAEASGSSDNFHDLITGESTPEHEGDIELTSKADIKIAQPSPISVRDSCFLENITIPAQVSVSAGAETKPSCIHFEELNPMVNLHNQAGIGPSTSSASARNLEHLEISSKHINFNLLHVQVDRKDEAEFNYVRDVLELSGFCGNEHLGTWHSPDQPVDLSVFEEMESCLPLKPNCSETESALSSDHQLLFDLINELLIEIYEMSFMYWPRPLSFSSHIRPMPTKHHVLEEVWARINWYLCSEPELDQSMNYLVYRDFTRSDGWMNLQFDIECVAIELEDLILDDLLEEVICP